jgi:hypothetical protein
MQVSHKSTFPLPLSTASDPLDVVITISRFLLRLGREYGIGHGYRADMQLCPLMIQRHIPTHLGLKFSTASCPATLPNTKARNIDTAFGAVA